MFLHSAEGKNREGDTVALFSTGKERQEVDFKMRDLLCHVYLEKLACKLHGKDISGHFCSSVL